MSVTVAIPTQLRSLTGGDAEVQASGATLLALIEDLDRRYAGFAERLLDGGRLRPFVNVYIGDEDARFLDGLAAPIPSGTRVAIIPAVSGGSADAGVLEPERVDIGVAGLRCRVCGEQAEVSVAYYCSSCFGPFEVVYDYASLDLEETRTIIGSGPRSLWRYQPLLPAPPRSARVDIGAGMTPLRRAPRLAAELGLRNLWLKLDLRNPTSSFKDRVVTVALSVARAFGLTVAACASTGNLAHSVAAHAASVGLRSVVFIPRGLEQGKVAAASVHGADVVEIEGSYDDVNRLCSELASSRAWGFVNVNLRPYYTEGSKTIAFEIAEQLGWRAPDAVVAPIASGAMLTKIDRGFGELSQVGLTSSERVRIFGGQAAGCAPVAEAFESGADEVTPVKAATVAKSLAIGTPGDGIFVLEAARRSNGAIVAVAEDAIVDAIGVLARTEGVFTEPAGGVTIATLEALVRSGEIDPDEEVVAVITGHGLKTVEVSGSAADRGVLRAAASAASVEAELGLCAGRSRS